MKIETHTPEWQDPNGIAAFVRHSSRPNSKADQQPTRVSGPHKHPELGLVMTIVVDTPKDGSKANTVIMHLPIKSLSQWVTKAIPDTPKVGVDTASADMALDFDHLEIPGSE